MLVHDMTSKFYQSFISNVVFLVRKAGSTIWFLIDLYQ